MPSKSKPAKRETMRKRSKAKRFPLPTPFPPSNDALVVQIRRAFATLPQSSDQFRLGGSGQGRPIIAQGPGCFTRR